MLTQWLEIKARGCCRHVFLVIIIKVMNAGATTLCFLSGPPSDLKNTGGPSCVQATEIKGEKQRSLKLLQTIRCEGQRAIKRLKPIIFSWKFTLKQLVASGLHLAGRPVNVSL